MRTIMVLLVLPAVGFAQEGADRGRYRLIPFEGSLERSLRQRLELTRELEKSRDFLEQLRKQTEALGLDRELVERLGAAHPGLNDLVRRWGETIQGKGLSRDQVRRLERDLQGLFRGRGPGPGFLNQGGPNFRFERLPFRPPPPAPAANEKIMEAARRWIDRIDQTDLSDWLARSPSWQKGVEGLNRFLAERREMDAGLRLPSSLPVPKNLGVDLTAGMLDRLGKLSLPTLPRIRPPGLRVRGLGLPGLGRPGTPSFAWLNVDEGLTWVAAGLLGILILWLSLPYLRSWNVALPRSGGNSLPALDLTNLRTRSQLRQAFDRLALNVLGDAARPWNHRTIAQALGQPGGEDGGIAPAARELADLYEAARYDRGPEELKPSESEAARRCLGLLAGKGS